MRKFFALLFFVLLCIALLSACENDNGGEIFDGSESSEESSSSSKVAGLPLHPLEPTESSSSEISMGIPEPPIPINKRVFRDYNGKYGLLDKDANVLVKAIYDKAEVYENFFIFSGKNENGESWAIVVNYAGEQIGREIGPGYEATSPAEKNETGEYFAAAVAYGKRQKRIVTNDRQIYTEEEPNREYLLLNSVGEPIFDITFDSYVFIFPATTPEEYYGIWAEKDGDFYGYKWSGEEYELKRLDRKGETGEEFFGYRKTQYYWGCVAGASAYGLNDSDGNVVFEPIYNRVTMPFEDRAILTYSSYSDTVECEGLQDIADLDGTILSNWNYIRYMFFEDGSWVGIARSNGENAEIKCRDANGNVRPGGVWFVDKDGQPISERFDELYFLTDDYREDYHPWYPKTPDDVAVAVTGDGETVEFSFEEYIYKP
ncbi:MAG: WG repeat-containing protein [Oscillospiraceae bacterium]